MGFTHVATGNGQHQERTMWAVVQQPYRPASTHIQPNPIYQFLTCSLLDVLVWNLLNEQYLINRKELHFYVQQQFIWANISSVCTLRQWVNIACVSMANWSPQSLQIAIPTVRLRIRCETVRKLCVWREQVIEGLIFDHCPGHQWDYFFGSLKQTFWISPQQTQRH